MVKAAVAAKRRVVVPRVSRLAAAFVPGSRVARHPSRCVSPSSGVSTTQNKEAFAIVNLSSFEGFAAGTEVTPASLREAGLIRHKGRVKVLAEGDLDMALTVKAHAFSASAKEKIENAGGTAEVI